MQYRCETTEWHALASGRRTAIGLPGNSLRVEPGDVIQAVQPDGTDSIILDVTDVALSGNQQVISVRRRPDPSTPVATLETPGGILAVLADATDTYPGYAITIDGVTAAVVEWHPTYASLVLRTYTRDADAPTHYATWDGQMLPAD